MKLTPTLAVGLTLTLVFAGCSGGGNSSTGDGAQPTGPVGDDVGAILGKVVDTELNPIGGAQIALASGARSPVSTDATGEFYFDMVPPGKETLYVVALGYSSTGKSLDIIAGETAEILFTLDHVATDDPFSELMIREGLIACGTGVGSMDAGAGATQVACGSAIDDENQAFLFTYDVLPNLKGALFEMRWTPSQALSKDLSLTVEKDGCDVTCEAEDTFGFAQGCCYIRVQLTDGNFTKGEGAMPPSDFTEGGIVQTRTFPAYGESTVPATVFTSQSFDIYAEFFYYELPTDFETRTNIVE